MVIAKMVTAEMETGKTEIAETETVETAIAEMEAAETETAQWVSELTEIGPKVPRRRRSGWRPKSETRGSN